MPATTSALPPNQWPLWFNGKSINEAIFCQQFLVSHPLVYTDGAFFTVEGRMTDESVLQGQIYGMLQCCASTSVTKKIGNIIDLLKITARVDELVPQDDRIHVVNGTLMLDGDFLPYNHQHEERKLASGSTSVYDYETYRCYRKISASRTCDGQSSYKATALNEAVEQQVKLFLSKLEAVPKERLVELASARNEETYKVAYKQAQKDFENAQKQVTALEEEAVKALTGESQLDLSIVNQMLLKHRAKLEAAQTAMEEAQTRMQAEQENAKATKAQVDELLSWAQCFDEADIGTKHLIVSRLIERVDVRTGYKVHIKFKISLKQFLGQE